MLIALLRPSISIFIQKVQFHETIVNRLVISEKPVNDQSDLRLEMNVKGLQKTIKTKTQTLKTALKLNKQ